MKNKTAGMSLIEVLVAVLLITITAIGCLQFLAYCNKFAYDADTKIMASNFARETMEELYQNSYDLLIPGSYDATDVFREHFNASRLHTRYGGTRTYTISDESSPGVKYHDTVTNTDYKVITVTVTWTP